MFRKIAYPAMYPEIEKNRQKTLVAIKKRKSSLTVFFFLILILIFYFAHTNNYNTLHLQFTGNVSFKKKKSSLTVTLDTKKTFPLPCRQHAWSH